MSAHILVKHHPERAHLLPALTARLTGLPTTIVDDPDPYAARRSSWRTFAACLDRLDQLGPDVTHVLILEDDVVCAPGFADRVDRLVSAYPDNPVALYISRLHGMAATELANPEAGHRGRRERVAAAARSGEDVWARLQPDCVPVQAISFPLPVALRLRDWATKHPPPPGWLDNNTQVTNFIRHERIAMLAPLASPVEHPDQERSVLTGQNGRRRVAYCYADRLDCRPRVGSTKPVFS